MEKANTEIKHLFPQASTVSFEGHPELSFKLRACTPRIYAEMEEAIGSVENQLSEFSDEGLSKIALFLMNNESRQHFKIQEINQIDVLTGKETKTKMGGFKLLAHMIESVDDLFNLYGAILQSLGYERESIKSIIKEIKNSIEGKEVKKKMMNQNPSESIG